MQTTLMPGLDAIRYFKLRPAAVFAAFLPICLLGCVGVLSAQQIEGIDLEGRRIVLRNASSRQPIVLIFVRTDCPISNRYAPTIQQLQAEFAGRAAFWLVYPDPDESPDKIKKHKQEYSYTLPALRDPNHELVKISHAEITPEVAVFDVHGELAYHGRIDNLYESLGRARSAATTHELKDVLHDVLAEKTPRVSSAPAIGCSISDMQ